MSKDKNKKKFSIKEYWKETTDVHFLLGCRFDVFMKLLSENHFKIAPKRIPRVLYIGAISAVLSVPALAEEVYCKFKVYPFTKLKSPLFILGHWRSGTTYLFELLAEDSQFTYMNPASTYTTNNFLFMRKVIDNFMESGIGDGRPMDNMDYNIESPSEETFALASRNTRSCMNMVVFPKNYTTYYRYAFTKRMTMDERMQWEQDYLHILKKVVYEDAKQQGLTKPSEYRRLLLKSPDNTGHVEELLHLFPKARFVSIYRNPYKVIKSTLNMLEVSLPMLYFQEIPDREIIMDYLVDMYEDIYRAYLEEIGSVPKGHLLEIRYESFVKEPLVYLKRIYKELGIPGYKKAEPNFIRHIESVKDYKTNRFVIEPELKAKINRRLKFAFDYFGYEMEE